MIEMDTRSLEGRGQGEGREISMTQLKSKPKLYHLFGAVVSVAMGCAALPA